MTASNTPISLLRDGDVDGYCAALARSTARKYGKKHVTPLTGGGNDPFLYWFTNDRGERVAYIRGSYTRKKLPS